MARIRVFIAYGGPAASKIAKEIARCLWYRKIRPIIAVQGTLWSISVASQNDIFVEERKCRAVLAVNAMGSSTRVKFIREIEYADKEPSIPVVGLVMKGTPIPPVLDVGRVLVQFQRGKHLGMCDQIEHELREQIRLRRTNIVREDQTLPRSRRAFP